MRRKDRHVGGAVMPLQPLFAGFVGSAELMELLYRELQLDRYYTDMVDRKYGFRDTIADREDE